MHEKKLTILMADDDLDDCLLVQEALEEAALKVDLRAVHDGKALIDYLARRAQDAPHLILLDLNMPGTHGLEALRELKADSRLRGIPVIVLTTSGQETDIQRSYQLGASSFITKPSTFGELVQTMISLVAYWSGTARLPQCSLN